MPQHIRNQQQHVRQLPENIGQMPNSNPLKDAFGKIMHISTKQSFGTIVSILLFIILLGVLLAHYMGFITIPGLEGKLRKAAPASHLQYFFF